MGLTQRIQITWTPWAAIALKELRVQARDVFLLLRVAVMLAAPLVFLVIRDHPASAGISTPALIAAWSLLMAVYCAIETTPSPFGGEGNRLSLALLPVPSHRSLVFGKALAVVAPLVAQAWVIILVITIWHRPPLLTMSGYTVLVTVGVATAGFVLTCLSVRDIDLAQPVEGGAQAILVEHVPASPRRLAIIGVTIAVTIGMAAALVTLPWYASLAIIGVASPVSCMVASRDASRRLARLI